MPCGTAAAFQFRWMLCSRQNRRYPVGMLNPGICSIVNFRVNPQAMQNLAEEPLRRINPAAFGKIFRMVSLRKGCYLCRLCKTCVVLPKPGVSIWILLELLRQRQRFSVRIDRQRRRACRINTDSDNLGRIKFFVCLFRLGKSLLYR